MLATSTEGTAPRLEIEGVSKWFGATRALADVSLSLVPGEVHVLAGENGAGKSTLIRILSGAIRDFTGALRLDGRPARFEGPASARAHGVATLHQELALVPTLSVADNLALGAGFSALAPLRRAASRARAERLLARVGLELDVEREVSTLSLGERQLLEIARCLSEDARVFILDEPTSALAEADAERLFALLPRLLESGAAVLYISHRLPEIRRLADRISVLNDGKLVLTRTRSELTEPELLRAMIGHASAAGATAAGWSKDGRETRLVVRELSSEGPAAFSGVNFDLGAGEVLGLGGLMGSGASELVAALYGLRDFSGQASLSGATYRPHGPRSALSRGVAYLASDRRLSVFPELSVEHNATLTSLQRHTRLGVVAAARERAVVGRGVAELGIKAPSTEARAAALSGGNQQKLALLRCLLSEPVLLLLDDPTRGVDLAAKAQIHARIRERTRRGLAVIVFSSEPDELLSLCDRVLVLVRGRVAAELSGVALERQALQRAVMGGQI